MQRRRCRSRGRRGVEPDAPCMSVLCRGGCSHDRVRARAAAQSLRPRSVLYSEPEGADCAAVLSCTRLWCRLLPHATRFEMCRTHAWSMRAGSDCVTATIL